MIAKPVQLALYLLLATVIAESASSEEFRGILQAFFNLPIYFDSKSRDLLSDHNFVQVTHIYNSSWLQPDGLWLNVTRSENNVTISRCYLPFRLSSKMLMRRLSLKTVLLPVRVEDGEDGEEQMELVLVNTDNCNYAYAHSFALSPEKLFVHPSNKPSDESFTLIIYNDKKLCQGHTRWCRLFFNPIYYKTELLNFDFQPWWVRGILPAASFDSHFLTVSLLDEETRTQWIRLYNVTDNSAPSNYKELLTIPNFFTSYGFHGPHVNYRLHLSSLSYCWRTRINGYERNAAIHCVAFREDGTVLFNKTITYPSWTSVRHIESIPNGLILITSACLSFDKTCSTVDVAMITRSFKCIDDGNNSSCTDLQSDSSSLKNEMIEMKIHGYNLGCTMYGTMKFKTRVDLSNDSIEVNYLCLDSTYLQYFEIPLEEFTTYYIH